jgi:hypothetical protein
MTRRKAVWPSGAALHRRGDGAEMRSRAKLRGQGRKGGRLVAVLRLVCSGDVRGTYPLVAPVVVIGRGSACDIRLPGPAVSRTHCRLVRKGDDYLVEDLESSNGTYVNGIAVKERLLRDGDKLFVFPHVLRYEIGAPAPAEGGAAGEGFEEEGASTMRVDSDEIRGMLGREMGCPEEDEGLK